jgi:hypothetical protein
MNFEQINTFHWYSILSARVRLLVDESLDLYLQFRSKGQDQAKDYGFVVFPAAKAYEGFLKEYFFQMGLISEGMLRSDHFRLGKALNPDLPLRYRDEDWLYDDLIKACGEEVAEGLWRAWKEGRNQVFHYDYNAEDGLTLTQAEEKLQSLFTAMQMVEKCGSRQRKEED